MLLCSHEEDNEAQQSEKVVHKDKKYQWPHGSECKIVLKL